MGIIGGVALFNRKSLLGFYCSVDNIEFIFFAIQIMVNKTIHKILNYCMATIWLVNGLYCKVLNLVPRHQQIVSHILGKTYAGLFTLLIGLSEIAMGIWILSGLKTRVNAVVQIVIIAVMNTIEFIVVPDLLLWGKFNAVFAFLLICIIFYNEFYLNKKSVQ